MKTINLHLLGLVPWYVDLLVGNIRGENRNIDFQRTIIIIEDKKK